MARSPDRDEAPVTPAVIAPRHIVQIVVAGLVVSSLLWFTYRPLAFGTLLFTILFGVTFTVLTLLAYRVARKSGEWPPRS